MPSRTKRRPRRAAKRPKRWLAVVFALAVGAGAFWALLGGDGEPLGRIDAASRAELDRVLQEADGEAAR